MPFTIQAIAQHRGQISIKFCKLSFMSLVLARFAGAYGIDGHMLHS